ncbi:MAG: DUF262 domain-containing protein [Ruminococcus flavefaciens]|nr:DUF262 domain-containing protein [Ruminococcus flavefaciens]
MKSFTTKLINFFKMDTEIPACNFEAGKREMLIPLYQREYKWETEKVNTLIHDIASRDKFLGIVIFDEKEHNYEIVDGQQRATTCFLVLVALYNYFRGSIMEQRSILRLLKPYQKFILVNDSVGDFIQESGNSLTLRIDDDRDIYYQKAAFFDAYNAIEEFLGTMDAASVIRFRKKMLDCEFLILIKDTHSNTSPTEQIFLDINEKSQLLEVEDIFKGHCFENFDEEYYDELRALWIKLKKCGMEFKNKFNYDNLSHYLYLYLLENDNIYLPEKLVVNGKHYLDGKTMDETKNCLDKLINYGNCILNFYENIKKSEYRFVDLCSNSHEYRNTDDHKVLKTMAELMLCFKSAQYQKLPFMQLIVVLMSNERLRNEITHKNFRTIVSNLFIYTHFFITVVGKKSKHDIDLTVRDALQTATRSEILSAAKNLRINKIENYALKTNEKFENLSILYSIIDNYIANENWLSNIYTRENGYNLEHFIVPDKRYTSVLWRQNQTNRELKLYDTDSSYKKRTINFLIIDKLLNEKLDRFDIVSKIEIVRDWYNSRAQRIPKHISWLIQRIECMDSYVALINSKEEEYDENIVAEKYMRFLNDYFEEDHELEIISGLKELLKTSFEN